MKRLWISLAILTALLGGTLWNAALVTRAAHTVTVHLDRALEDAAQGDWADASAQVLRAQEVWNEWETYFSTVLLHSDMEPVKSGFSTLCAILPWEDALEFTEENRQLRAQVEHIAQTETLSLGNLL